MHWQRVDNKRLYPHTESVGVIAVKVTGVGIYEEKKKRMVSRHRSRHHLEIRRTKRKD